MARRKARTLTEVELEFMQVVWAAEGDVTTDDVLDALRRRGRELADGSVRKVLSILVAKGYLSRRRRGRGFLYRAKVARDQAARRMVGDLLRRAFDGAVTGMIAALLDGRTVDRRELDKIKRLIAEREREGRP